MRREVRDLIGDAENLVRDASSEERDFQRIRLRMTAELIDAVDRVAESLESLEEIVAGSLGLEVDEGEEERCPCCDAYSMETVEYGLGDRGVLRSGSINTSEDG